MDETADSPFKEWDSLSHLLYLVPEKEQKFGFLPIADLNITALDICANYLIAGTNTSFIYIIHRRKRSLLLKLKYAARSEDVLCITSTFHNSLLTIAYGTKCGNVFVYWLRGDRCKLEVEHSMQAVTKSQSCVKALQLSADCRDLYVGDGRGVVTVLDLTSRPLSMRLEGEVLLNESHSIVQLSLWTNLLLVSTTSASLIFNIDSKQVTKVGTKARKINGGFGGCLVTNKDGSLLAFCVRPGLRLWRCNYEGTVLTTHMYKDLVSQAKCIKLQGEASSYGNTAEMLTQFGTLKVVDECTLLSWYENTLALIDISDAQASLLIGVSSLCSIIDVACKDGDIFILGRSGTNRRLHRLSKSPDQTSTSVEELPLVANKTEGSTSSGVNDQDEETQTLPPVIEASDLTKLDIGEQIQTEQTGDETASVMEGQGEQPSSSGKLNKLEAKLQSGLSTVRDKLGVSGDGIKLVEQSMKQGFGSFLNKIQNIGPARKQVAIPEVKESPSPPPPTVIERVAQSRAAREDNPLDNLVADVQARRMSSTERRDSSSDSDDDGQIAIRLPPRKNLYAASISTAEDSQSQSGDNLSSANEPVVHKGDNSPVLVGACVQREDNFPLASECVANKKDSSSSIKELGSRLSLDNVESTEGMLESPPLSDAKISRKEHVIRSGDTVQGYSLATDPSLPSSEAMEEDHNVSGAELMSRLNQILGAKEEQSLDLLKAAVGNDNVDESGSSVWEEHPTNAVFEDIGPVENPSEGEDVQDSDEELSAPSDSDEEEEDIYKPRQTIKDSARIHLVSPQLPEMGEGDDNSKYSSNMTSEHWSCDTIASAVYGISAADNYVWMHDRSGAVWVAKCAEPSMIWRKLDVKAKCLSVAPSGSIAWRVYKGKAYAGHCKTRPFTPWSMKWTEAVQGVTSVAVDDTCAWYIKSNGEVWLQTNLSKDRPMKHGNVVPCQHSLKKISSRCGVTWALSNDGRVYAYQPSSGRGSSDWVPVNEVNNIVDICVGVEGATCWLIDSSAVLTCLTTISSLPIGQNQTWQVIYQEGISLDSKHRRHNMFGGASVHSMAPTPSATPLLVTVSKGITCVAHPNSTEDISVSRTHSFGYNWRSVSVAGLSDSTKWKSVNSVGRGKLIAMFETGELFYLDTKKHVTISINLPTQFSEAVVKISQMYSCSLSLWLLLNDGTVFYTIDTSDEDRVRLGLFWNKLDTYQFGGKNIRSISVGQTAAWVIDTSGAMYMSVGVNAKRDCQLMNPAWIPIEVKSEGFQSVYVNDRNTMVWASDHSGNVFARQQVTAELPIGTAWVQVEGVQAKDLCLSDNLVWAITTDSSIVCRVGVTEERCEGDSWKRVPCSVDGSTAVRHVTADSQDRVYGLTGDDKLVTLKTQLFGDLKEKQRPSQQMDGDWELL